MGLRDNTRTLAGSGTKPLVWERIGVGTLGLFSNHEEYFTRSQVIGTALSDIASEELWGSPEFRWLVLLTDVHPIFDEHFVGEVNLLEVEPIEFHLHMIGERRGFLMPEDPDRQDNATGQCFRSGSLLERSFESSGSAKTHDSPAAPVPTLHTDDVTPRKSGDKSPAFLSDRSDSPPAPSKKARRC